MTRLAIGVGAVIALLAMAAAQAPAAPSWQEIDARAEKAHKDGDFAAYRTNVQQLYEMLSGNSEIAFAMARAEARLGHAEAALGWLRTYAAMGLYRDLATVPDLAGLAAPETSPGLAAVKASLEANRLPVARAVRVARLADADLLTEDIAFDARGQRFLVSSIHEGKIVAVDRATGAMSDFVPAGRDSVWGVLALAVDAPRGVLWATTAAMPQAPGYRAADAGRSAVLRYDLASGRLLQRYDLPLPATAAAPPTDGAQQPAGAPQGGATEAERSRVLGDMTVAPNGDVFVSEAVAGAVYTIPQGADRLATLVAAGLFISPQNPALLPGGKLLVADYTRGFGVVDLKTRAVSWMSHPAAVALDGTDGMYAAGDFLIAVQNGTNPNRIIRLDLDASHRRITGWQPLESGSPGLGSPTHGTLVGRDFYFLANSGWERFAEDGTFKPGQPAEIWRLSL